MARRCDALADARVRKPSMKCQRLAIRAIASLCKVEAMGSAEKCVLVVDDCSTVVESVARALGGTARVYAATSGSEALAIARGRHLDLALIDWAMPDPHGSEVVRSLHASHPNTMIIVLSGEDPDDVHTASIHAGAEEFMPKPFNARELRRLVEKALARISAERPRDLATMEQVEREHILHALRVCGGNKTLVAKMLGISRSSLLEKLKAMDVEP